MLKRVSIAVAASFLAASAVAQDTPSYDSLLKTANEGFEAENWRAVATALDAAQEFRPYSQFITRNRVLAYSMLGEFSKAESIVREYADRGLSIRLTGHPGFDTLTSRTKFAPLRDKMAANLLPIGESSTAVELPEDGFLPETYAARSKNQFVGSVRTGKIVRAGGGDFATAPGGVYSLEIVGNTLWTATNTAAPYEKSADATAHSVLIAYSLKDATQASAVTVGDEATLIGDIENTPAGLIASDSITPRLFALRKGADAPAILAQDWRFVNLQGLAYDKRRNLIFVADYLAGLFSVDVETGAVGSLANPANAHLGGIDGLYLYKGDLIGIQNGTSPQRIVKIDLNDKGNAAEKLTVLVQSHPQWSEPTNGQIVGDNLLYVATSNWPAYGEDGAVNENVTRAPVRIMSVSVKTES